MTFAVTTGPHFTRSNTRDWFVFATQTKGVLRVNPKRYRTRRDVPLVVQPEKQNILQEFTCALR